MSDKDNHKDLRRLRELLAEISDLNAAAALMHWDQQTYMPEGGVGLRSEQLATVSRLAHERLVSPELGELLEQLDGTFDPSSEEAALVRVARRDHERAAKLPSRLVAETARAASEAEPVWVSARADSDWEAFAPHLERLLELRREAAEHLGYEEHPYDALLDLYEPGARKSRLEGLFDELKADILPLLHRIAPDGVAEDRSAPLVGDYDERVQEEFGRAVLTDLGYDWSRGRQDRVVHAFCIDLGGPQDVRITTRFDPRRVDTALFTSMHEAGHAMYEQGVSPDYARSPLAGGVSMGVHESQSRLWENLVGRSRAFWEHYYPKLQEAFPDSPLGKTDLETFYRAVNEVRPSTIRIDADELTYNLHVLLRFELEVAMIEGRLAVSEIPEAWEAKMEEYLGVRPKDVGEGPLQDIHWADGLFGYFPSYTVGNVLSAQFFEAAVGARPEIPDEIREGRFGALQGWLTENVYRHGRRYEPEELVERATGRPLEAAPYLRYLREKFGALYAG
ncbi:Thermostable carboxypeptidase 1 [Rubrobacter xylanophilus DSM 9941]|uniref:carboxypeptidase M32 n=1 Tax=Rubrobacter xylanophilus TaxID=49319 RepID=UPI001C644A9B|nr:carboxypeptidase M32 [Rubrobacter xylanophilus]QYJ14339.1 Thermostable carboxypeptidase 1 [Rubrobacter xylanophilus DSM 9941]